MGQHDPIWSAGLAPEVSQLTDDNLQVDTVVIGAGLSGLSAAYHLLQARPGQQLIVLEAKQVGAGASTRSTGMLTPGIGQNLAGLIKRVGAEQARAMYEKTLWAVEYVAGLAKELAIDCEVELNGQLMVAHGAKGSTRLKQQAKAFAELNLPHELLNAAELQNRIKLQLPESAAELAAIALPLAGTLNPGKLLAGLASAINQSGGVIYEQAKVVAISDGQPAIVTLEGGAKITAKEVVLATSGYTPDLNIFRGRVLPVHLSVLLTEPLTEADMAQLGWQGRECIIDSRRLFNYFRLTKDNRIIFGGGLPRYHWGGATQPQTEKDFFPAELHQEFVSTIPGAEHIRIERNWNGLIDYVLDALPVIERLNNKPAVTHVGGWCGHGVALSVASGAWVARMQTQGVLQESLPWFRQQPPLLPFETVRWLGFRATTGMMALMDKG